MFEDCEEKIPIEFSNNEALIIHYREKTQQYNFDNIFNGEESQQDVYEKVAKPIVECNEKIIQPYY